MDVKTGEAEPTNGDKLLVIGPALANDPELSRLAEREEFAVFHAEGRADGLAKINMEQPSVVLVAHELDSDSGIDLLKEIRRKFPACEAIFVTADGTMDAAMEVMRAGALDYLHQPIDRQQLDLALGRARERRNDTRGAGSVSILVVDDHEYTLKHLVNVLSKEGYRVFGAANGAEAIRLFKEKRIDIIFSDLMMPGKDGFDVLKETKGAGGDVEVIVVTGHGDENTVVRALRAGAINFLKKPIEIEHMLLAIERALEHQTLRRSLAYRNREMELMQDLVVRLTEQLELVVETPFALTPNTVSFLEQLVGALPFGVLVLRADGSITFANRHVQEKTAKPPAKVSAEWLRPMGLANVTEKQFQDAFARTLSSKPGYIETLAVSNWAFLMMTPLRILRPELSECYVAIAIRGERNIANVPQEPTK